VLYIVTTLGVPLRVDGSGGSLFTSEHSSVDSELALLYSKLKGVQVRAPAPFPTPSS